MSQQPVPPNTAVVVIAGAPCSAEENWWLSSRTTTPISWLDGRHESAKPPRWIAFRIMINVNNRTCSIYDMSVGFSLKETTSTAVWKNHNKCLTTVVIVFDQRRCPLFSQTGWIINVGFYTLRWRHGRVSTHDNTFCPPRFPFIGKVISESVISISGGKELPS